MFSRRACLLVVFLACGAATGCMPDSWLGRAPSNQADPYSRVVTGLDERQVVAIMGEPNRRQQVTAGEVPEGKVGLVYRWIDSKSIIKVYFLDGLVVGKERI